MLVGLPGSGKSTFCKLFQSCPLKTKIVNQDEMGRKQCEKVLLPFVKEADVTILDRVNFTKKDRREWLSIVALNPSQCLCIYLTTPSFICIDRAKRRENHPTIKKGGGERIIRDIESKLEVPTKEEGFMDVIELQDEEDVRNYLKSWKCTTIEVDYSNDDTQFIHKFPRTPHLFNIGGATADDRLLAPKDHELFSSSDQVSICEKVDGAQLGISIDEQYKIMVQNRSHYVNSKSHAQFKKLDKWIIDHADALYEILDPHTILFGEWLFAKHSILYDRLPDYFIAFDLYDKRSKVYYHRNILEKKVQNTNIVLVREIYNGTLPNRKQLLNMINTPSEYTTQSKLEGIYLKVHEDKYVRSRCKLIRNDFIAGNQHWSRHNLQQNQLEVSR